MGASVRGLRIDRPKQFCRFEDSGSLLRRTLRRARGVSPPGCVIPVVCESHRQWWTDDLQDVPLDNIIVQPRNRGTTLAILHALVHILRRDLDATIVVHPCDHAVDFETPMRAALDRAVRWATRRPGDLVLIGAVPGDPETEYGWIMPEPGAFAGAARVQVFVEKPASPTAHRLLRAGGLWNTFLFAVSALGLLEKIVHAVPVLAGTYLDRMSVTRWQGDSLADFYQSVPDSDFSHEVLERIAPHLYVVPLRGCRWTDLGTPARVEAWLTRTVDRCPSSNPDSEAARIR